VISWKQEELLEGWRKLICLVFDARTHGFSTAIELVSEFEHVELDSFARN
jgi:hypothetical protein